MILVSLLHRYQKDEQLVEAFEKREKAL